MTLGICISAAVLGCIINICYWQTRCGQVDGEKKKIKIEMLHGWKQIGLVFVMLLSMSAISVLLALKYPEQSVIFDLKRIALLLILFPAAWSDYKEHIIPNSILLIGLSYWGILTGLEFVFQRIEFKRYILAELVLMVVVFVAMMLLKLIAKDGIGMGDIKLLMVMALLQGSEGFVSSVMTSIIMLFFIAVILLVTKKKGRKDVIPFGPAILVGTYISVFTMGA